MQGDPCYSQLVSLANRTKLGSVPGSQEQVIHSKEINACQPPQGGLYGLLTDTDKQGNQFVNVFLTHMYTT